MWASHHAMGVPTTSNKATVTPASFSVNQIGAEGRHVGEDLVLVGDDRLLALDAHAGRLLVDRIFVIELLHAFDEFALGNEVQDALGLVQQ